MIGASEFLTGGGPVDIVSGPGATVVVNDFRSAGDGDNNGYVEATVTGFNVPLT